jgi:hypothetical protein
MATGSVRTQGIHKIDGRYSGVLTNAVPNGAKADTVFLMGDLDPLGATYKTGQFQLDAAPSVPDEEGWMHIDLTNKSDSKWNISTYNADLLDESVPGNSAMWCGEAFPACSASDPVGGYGNNYNELLDWTATVDVVDDPTEITVGMILNYDNEPGYDYLYLNYETSGGWLNAGTWNGSNKVAGVFVPVTEAIVINYAANTYVGTASNEVHLRLLGFSDGAWSDADCLHPTAGLAQVDNITVGGDNGIAGTFDDFESGVLGMNWETAAPNYVGDFAKVWPSLGSEDPCIINKSPQFAFIDDGIVENCDESYILTGTVGAPGHTYGVDGGWAVNLLGGCGGPTAHMQNEIWSPILDWPVGDYVGAEFSFGVYRDLPVTNGMFYVWHVNSVDASGIWGGWADRNFVYYGSTTDYLRVHNNVTDLLVQSPVQIQLALGTNELGYVWGLEGTDATPGPYFDNVAFRVFPASGPSITTRDLEVAQDNFPTSGDIAFGGGAYSLDIRFDMANDIVGDTSPAIDPGDSITFLITAVRPGASLYGTPELRWTMKQNPAFDASFRTSPYLMATSGTSPGFKLYTDTGVEIPDRYGFDLPDSSFFFPGDVIHYYIFAQDIIGTDLGSVTDGTMPGNLNGYGEFLTVVDTGGDANTDPDKRYPSMFTVHGLPSLSLNEAEDGYVQPSILFYNDNGDRGGENEWYFALAQLGFHRYEDYDIYYTNAPSSGVSNGLGSRATSLQLAGYNTMLYSSGALQAYTLNELDQDADKSDDLSLLDLWLLQGGKNLLMTGDGILTDLQTTIDGSGVIFRDAWLGVNYNDFDVTDVIGYKTAPMVQPTVNADLTLPRPFIAFGSCPSINHFDEFTPSLGTVSLANYVGVGPVYPAVTYRKNTTVNTQVVFAGVDFEYWYTVKNGVPDALSSRAENLSAILTKFGESSSKGIPTGAPVAKPFFARNYPNPFNPITKIEFSVPKAGDVSVKIYNVRGELVRTLVDEHMDATDLVVREWNGTNTQGAAVASGVYFYETRTNGNVKVNKMALVK